LKLPNIVFTNYIGIAAASSQNTKSAWLPTFTKSCGCMYYTN
jgi:hypothetical protein